MPDASWLPSHYLLRIWRTTCACCGRHTTHDELVLIHRRAGKYASRTTRVEPVSSKQVAYRYPDLPRGRSVMQRSVARCDACFTDSPGVEHPTLDIDRHGNLTVPPAVTTQEKRSTLMGISDL